MAHEEQIGSLHAVMERVESTDRFVLTSHARPHRDAVGSVLAC
jgi:nanoRNase/pAp phosphatase (c-di-AMP/oligoRNAs hydrolase)